jgi:hypothetical protein
MNISKTQQFILKVIEDNPGVQNDEAKLIAAVWRKQNWTDGRSLEDNLRHVMHPETISRRRRELFNKGLITYSPETMNERTEAFKSEQNNSSDYEQAFMQMFGGNPLDNFPKLKRGVK